MPRSIWIIEDSNEIREEASWELTRFGFIVSRFCTGGDALAELETDRPSLILLDAILPDMKIGEFCRRLKEAAPAGQPPLVAIAPDGDTAGTLLSSHLCIEDCLVKPFTPHALVTRVSGIMSGLNPRTASARMAAADRSRKPAVNWSPDSRRALVDGKAVQLAPIEHKLLGIMFSHKGTVFSRGELLSAIWNSDSEVSQRSVDVAMVSLRRKLGAAGPSIQTVRGKGYRFVD